MDSRLIIIMFAASIFAYGQTSSGKTFTMTGITEYTLADIYDYVQKVITSSHGCQFQKIYHFYFIFNSCTHQWSNFNL